MQQTIFLTGSAGFLGRKLARRLVASGYAVIGFDPTPSHTPQEGIKTVIGDVRYIDSIRRAFDGETNISAIVHAGGVSGGMILRDQPASIIDINIAGTTNVMEVAREFGVGRMIFCSSIMAYGPTAGRPVNEEAPLLPKRIYGATKAACEALLHSYASEFGISSVQLRIAHVYGPERTSSCPLQEMVTAAMQRQPVVVDEAADSLHQFIHVDDVVDALMAALRYEQAGSLVANIGPGHSITLAELAQVVRNTLGPLNVTYAAEPPSGESVIGDLCIARAREALGWVPRIELAQGLSSFTPSA